MLTSTSNHYTQKEKRRGSTIIADAYASYVNISNNVHMKPNKTGARDCFFFEKCARDCCIKGSKSDVAQEAHENEQQNGGAAFVPQHGTKVAPKNE